MIQKSVIGACLVSLLGGCQQSSVASLEGEYGIASNGKIEPFIKVEKTIEGYVFEEYRGGTWRTGKEVAQPVTPQEFERFMGVRPQGTFVALHT